MKITIGNYTVEGTPAEVFELIKVIGNDNKCSSFPRKAGSASSIPDNGGYGFYGTGGIYGGDNPIVPYIMKNMQPYG